MTEYYCPECGEDWPGTYRMDHRCTVCMTPIKAVEKWREEEEEVG